MGDVRKVDLHGRIGQVRVVGQAVDRVDVEQCGVGPGAARIELGGREVEPDLDVALGGEAVPAVQFGLLQGGPAAIRLLGHAAHVLAEITALIAAREPDGQLDVVRAGRKGRGDEQFVATVSLDAVSDWGHSMKSASMGMPVHPLVLGNPMRADRGGAMSRMLERTMLSMPLGTPGPMMRKGTCVS